MNDINEDDETTTDLINDIIQIIEISGSLSRDVALKYKIIPYTWIFLAVEAYFIVITCIQAEFDTFSYGLASFIMTFYLFMKYASIFLNRSHISKLLEILKNPLFLPREEQERIILKRTLHRCRVFRKSYMYLLMLSAGIICISPIFGRKSIFPFPLDMTKQPLIIFAAIWCFQTIVSGCAGWHSFIMETLLYYVMEIAAAQLEMLRERIIHSTDTNLSTLKPIHDKYGLDVNNIPRNCVTQHVTIERYIKLIEQIFTYTAFAQLLGSLIVLCWVAFNWTLYPVYSIQFAQYFVMLMLVTAQNMIFCVPGNKIIDASEKIRDSCYMSNWIYCRPSVRKSLLLIMKRSEHPFALTAAKFVPLSHETLMNTLKLAFSYFNLLRSIYKNSDK